MLKEKIIEKLENEKVRSTWDKGVVKYALDLLKNSEGEEITEKTLLNGAGNWYQYSYGGCSLIYDEDICNRLCTQTEKKKTRNGEYMPNKKENWLDVQARALMQACCKIINLKNEIL